MSDMDPSRSLLERAAEVYDFGSLLRAPAAAPVVKPEPIVELEPQPEPEPAPVVVEAPKPRPRVAARPRVARDVFQEEVRERVPAVAHQLAEVDRAALARAGCIVPDAAVSGLAEEFRLVKHRLLAAIEGDLSAPEERRRSVLVCSAQPRSGKTFCAVNLALSLAGEKDVEVLLVDGDFIKPAALAMLGIAPGPGFVEALAVPDADPESFVIRTDVPGLSVLPAGAKANNVPELLASERSREVLAKLVAGDKRRIILFDSPPALMASHATVLAGLVGRALVVVRADQTTEADLRETIGLLAGCDVSLLLNGAGLAVTGRRFGAYDGYRHED